MVAKWVQLYLNRFLAAYNHWCDGKPETVANFESEWKAGKWRQLASLGFHTEDIPSMIRRVFPYLNLHNVMRSRSSSTQDLGGPNPQGSFAPKFRIALSDPLLLEDVAIPFPKLKIVIMHMGWPFYDHALYMLWAYENVYLDTATVNWMLGRDLFNRMLRAKPSRQWAATGFCLAPIRWFGRK